MNEKIKSFFEKVGLCFAAAFLFLLGLLLGNRLQNKENRVGENPTRVTDLKRNRERAAYAASTISEIIGRVKERGGVPEE